MMVWFSFMFESFLILLRIVFFQQNLLRIHIDRKILLKFLRLHIGFVGMLILGENCDTLYICSCVCESKIHLEFYFTTRL